MASAVKDQHTLPATGSAEHSSAQAEAASEVQLGAMTTPAALTIFFQCHIRIDVTRLTKQDSRSSLTCVPYDLQLKYFLSLPKTCTYVSHLFEFYCHIIAECVELRYTLFRLV